MYVGAGNVAMPYKAADYGHFLYRYLAASAERRGMAQLYVIGRVTADFELKTSFKKQTPYVRFGLAEQIGYGEYSKTQYLQVWAWGEDAKHLAKAKVKKGSLIWISGALELEEYIIQDGSKTDKRLKVILDRWGYIPADKPKRDYSLPNSVEPDTKEPHSISPDGVIDGEREELPE